MILVTPEITLDDDEIDLKFIRASGPGGQHVNKTATAVQLRFDVVGSPTLDSRTRLRLARLAGRRLSSQGILTIDARQYRTQARNREDAIQRLMHLIRQAAATPKPRRKSRPTAASRERRLQTKRQRSAIKKSRQKPTSE
jgi:ribosome-associated protein